MSRRGKFLPITIVLGVILSGAVIYQYGYLGIRGELAEREDAASVKMKTLTRYLTLLADRPALEERLIALRETRKMEKAKIIEGQTAPLAAATLQNTVKEVITSRGGSIASERVEKPEKTGYFTTVTVAIDAILPDTRALGDTLLAIETQTPYLVIRELDTRIRNFRDPRDLTVRLKVSGLTEGR
ncbi:MAG: type II secretion system protein GspM [Syntrophales bacterium]